jgi:signal transduction histidine kinase
MKNSKFPLINKKIKIKLTLHQQIELLTTGVVVILGFVLILFINLIAPIFIAHEVGIPNTYVHTNTVDANGNPITVTMETPGPEGYTIYYDPGTSRADPLTVIRTLSMIGLASITGLAFFASKWVAKNSLQPVKQISKIAQQISFRNLDQRLNYQGAQDEVKILADAFDLMLQRLEMNFKDQGEFISNLAHELRTPLTSLRMNLEVLNTDPQATLEEYQDFSETAERAINRLEHLVEDFLLLAKGEKEIDLHRIILGVLFEEILEELSPIAEEHGVMLEMNGDLELEIWGDPVLLHRAFENLIENSIHYNHPGGVVKIASRRENNQGIVEIQDNGIGISEQQQAHIFKRFYRVKEAARYYQNGKGLGLAITAHIISLHNGKIGIESTLGKGSTFRITLPINK